MTNTSRVKKLNYITLKLLTNLLLPILFLSSCVEDDLLKVNPNPQEVDLGTFYTDSLEINTYVTLDSVNTTNRNAMLAGHQQIPDFGTTTAEAYFQLTSIFKLGFGTPDSRFEEYLADSLNITTTILGDTNLTYRIRVFEVLADIDSIDYYQVDKIDNIGDMIGEVDYTHVSGTNPDSLLAISISDTFGEKIFNQNGQDSIFTNQEFLAYIKGIKITVDVLDDPTGVGGFLRFSEPASGIFEVVSKSTEAEPDTAFMSFFLGWHFNHISADLTGSPLEGLDFGETLATNNSTLNNIGYIQAGTGINTIIEIPDIVALAENLPTDSTELRINDAKLAFMPIEGTIMDLHGPPNTILIELPDADTIALNTSDPMDDFALSNMGFTRSSIGTIVPLNQRGMAYNETGKSYPKLNITEYIQVLYEDRYKTPDDDRITGRFKFIPSSQGFSASTLKIGGSKLPVPDDFPASRQSPAMKLEVYYTIIDILR